MEVQITIDDLPSTKKNCSTCTRKGIFCERSRVFKNNPNGYVFNSCTKSVSGVISCCVNYTGPFVSQQLNLEFYDD